MSQNTHLKPSSYCTTKYNGDEASKDVRMQFFVLFLRFSLQSKYLGNIKWVTKANIVSCWIHEYQRLLQPSLLPLFIVSADQLLMQLILTSCYLS